MIKHQTYKDNRGYFVEIFNKVKQKELECVNFKQINCSFSKCNTIRGLHLQLPPFAQSKYIYCISGEIYDVMVDINPDSPTYGHWWSNILRENESLFVKSEMAHGFYAMKDSLILYNVTEGYNKESERTIIYNDKDLNIKWPIKNLKDIIVSPKDSRGIRFKDLCN